MPTTPDPMLALPPLMSVIPSINTLVRVGILCVVGVLMLGLILLTHRGLMRRLKGAWANRIPGLRIQGTELVPSSQIASAVMRLLYWIRILLVALLAYVWLGLMFRLFPQTESMGRILTAFLWDPAKLLLLGMLRYLPNLVLIVFIVILTRMGLSFIRSFFDSLERRKFSFEGFHPEWAMPTYRLVRLGVFTLGLVLAFPYLPGAGSDAFKAVGLFVGAILSLGSTGVVGNLMAGTLLGYMHPYREGDYVRVADTEGFVIQRSLLLTRIRTIQNEEITLANTKVLDSRITNFNAGGTAHKVHIHTSVTIGYDVPWRQVHGLLLAAAAATEGIVMDPAPFVLQTALDDFYVRYELNAAVAEPLRLPYTTSALHQGIQDAFFNSGVEICSPHFAALRDGNTVAIPEAQRPVGYQAPGFRIEPKP